MRIIPKKIKVRSNVWKCYSMKDIFVALVVFALVFVSITMENWVLAVILGLAALVMFMPTGDGIFYTYIFENIRFAIGKKKYTKTAEKEKERIDAISELSEIKENGLLVYKTGHFGRVIKVGQKNFKIEDEQQQNVDIDYFANALKMLEETQSADIVKIDRPVTLDSFSSELFEKLSSVKKGNLPPDIKEMRANVLSERIDRIDELNNIIKQYASEYYIVIYGRDELDLENTAVNIAAEINKCGLRTKVLTRRPVAIFLKYCYFRNFDEREINDLTDEEKEAKAATKILMPLPQSNIAILFPVLMITMQMFREMRMLLRRQQMQAEQEKLRRHMRPDRLTKTTFLPFVRDTILLISSLINGQAGNKGANLWLLILTQQKKERKRMKMFPVPIAV